jgi:hypothetical protein
MKIKITKATNHGIHHFTPGMIIEATPGLVNKLINLKCAELVPPRSKKTTKKPPPAKENIIPADIPVSDEINITEPLN